MYIQRSRRGTTETMLVCEKEFYDDIKQIKLYLKAIALNLKDLTEIQAARQGRQE